MLVIDPLPFPSLTIPALALGVALIATGVLRLAGGATRGPWIAPAGAGIGFLAGGLLITRLPPFPPLIPEHRIVYLAAAAVIAGAAIELTGCRRSIRRLLLAAACIAGVAWLAPEALLEDNIVFLLRCIAGAAVGILILRRLDDLRGIDAAPGVLILWVALAMAAIAWLAGAAIHALFAAILAASCGGYLLWNWPRARDGAGAPLLLGGAAMCVWLGVAMVIYTDTPVVPLAALCVLFEADRLVPPRWRHGARQPVLVSLAGLALAGGAVALHWLLRDTGWV